MKNCKVVIFNSPPRGGKGLVASHMTNKINNLEGNLFAYHKEFKDELFEVAANTLNISRGDFLRNYDSEVKDVVESKYLFNVQNGTWWKDVPIYEVHGRQYSKRSWLIHVSENVVKPSFGKDAFGKMLANALPQEGVVFVSDGGFVEEIQAIVKEVGEDNILVVRIHREGCDFSNDSRDYLKRSQFNQKVNFRDIDNNSSIKDFFDRVEKVVGDWL